MLDQWKMAWQVFMMGVMEEIPVPESHLSELCVQVCGTFQQRGAEALGRQAAGDAHIQVSVRGGHDLGQAVHSRLQRVKLPHNLILASLQGSNRGVHVPILRGGEIVKQIRNRSKYNNQNEIPCLKAAKTGKLLHPEGFQRQPGQQPSERISAQVEHKLQTYDYSCVKDL